MKDVRAWFSIEAEIEEGRRPKDWADYISGKVEAETVQGFNYQGVETVDDGQDLRNNEMVGGSLLTEAEQIEKSFVARGMWETGGVFFQKLGELVALADRENFHRIKKAFPEYWEHYLEIGKEKAEEQS